MLNRAPVQVVVALFEDTGGTRALRRSYDLVRADWLRMVILLMVFAILSWVTRVVAGEMTPKDMLFSLVSRSAKSERWG